MTALTRNQSNSCNTYTHIYIYILYVLVSTSMYTSKYLYNIRVYMLLYSVSGQAGEVHGRAEEPLRRGHRERLPTAMRH